MDRHKEGCINGREGSLIDGLPVLQIIGYKNSGKTTLASKLIAKLTERGLNVGSAKHDAHEFQLDDDGTDSQKHLDHGAVETLLTSGTATRIMRRSPTKLEEIARYMSDRVDIVIAEGFKAAPFPKVALISQPDDMLRLQEQASNIRIWVSWADPREMDASLLNSLGDSPAPILYLQDDASVLKETVNLALSLL